MKTASGKPSIFWKMCRSSFCKMVGIRVLYIVGSVASMKPVVKPEVETCALVSLKRKLIFTLSNVDPVMAAMKFSLSRLLVAGWWDLKPVAMTNGKYPLRSGKEDGDLF